MGHYDSSRPGYCASCGAAPGNLLRSNGSCPFCEPGRHGTDPGRKRATPARHGAAPEGSGTPQEPPAAGAGATVAAAPARPGLRPANGWTTSDGQFHTDHVLALAHQHRLDFIAWCDENLRGGPLSASMVANEILEHWTVQRKE